MKPRQPSRTAHGAASHRAAHQTLENAAIFADPFACAILGETPQAVAEREAAEPRRRPMRLFVSSRSRFAEDSLAAAVARGVRQAAVLGAGLDTFALRNPHAPLGLRVFEVDHPATQLWKRERLTRSGLPVPGSLTFAPVDFERDNFLDALAAAGFRADHPTFFLWLGVVPYLTREAVFATLRSIATIPGAEVVFDYGEPYENLPPARRQYLEAMAARVAALGEPWLSRFDPEDLWRDLRGLGFAEIEDLGFHELRSRFFADLIPPLDDGPGPHAIRARRLG